VSGGAGVCAEHGVHGMFGKSTGSRKARGQQEARGGGASGCRRRDDVSSSPRHRPGPVRTRPLALVPFAGRRIGSKRSTAWHSSAQQRLKAASQGRGQRSDGFCTPPPTDTSPPIDTPTFEQMIADTLGASNESHNNIATTDPLLEEPQRRSVVHTKSHLRTLITTSPPVGPGGR